MFMEFEGKPEKPQLGLEIKQEISRIRTEVLTTQPERSVICRTVQKIKQNKGDNLDVMEHCQLIMEVKLEF